MNSHKRRFWAFSIAAGLGLMLCAPALYAQAQNSTNSSASADTPSPSNEGWHVIVAPYLWFAGVHGTVGVAGREASVHVSPSDVLNYVNLGVMVAVEPRYNRVLFPVDFMWIKLSDDEALPISIVAVTAKSKFKQSIFTPKVGYRIFDQKALKVAAVFGIRYWHLDGSLEFQPSLMGNTFSGSADWVDAVGGGKFQVALAPRVTATILGDAGGANAKLDYQVAGLLGFRVTKKLTMQAGYRYLYVDYRPESTFVYNVRQSGVLFGVTWSVK
jgi:hypothetical protein